MKGVAFTLDQVIKFVTLLRSPLRRHEVLEDIKRDPEAKVVEDLICYELGELSSDCYFLTDANLEEQEITELIHFHIANIEVFAWTPYEMPGIDPNFIKHKLNVLPEARLVKQRGRRC